MQRHGFPTLPGVTHRFVNLPGLRMHVTEAGTGDPVLLLHGFPSTGGSGATFSRGSPGTTG